MFDQQWYDPLKRKFSAADADAEVDNPRLLLEVELAFRLLEIIGLTDEPADVVWSLLSALPIPHYTLTNLDNNQIRALANARVLLHFGRFAWRDALYWYSKLPAQWRVYQVDAVQPLNKPAQREPNGPAYVTNRVENYDNVLQKKLSYNKHAYMLAGPGRITFRTTRQRPRTIAVDLDAEMVSATPAGNTIPQFNSEERPHRPIIVDWAGLRNTANLLDQRVEERKLDQNSAKWRWLLEQVIRLRFFENDGSLSQLNGHPLKIEGMLHLAGMVGAGKSTLMKLLAAHGALTGNWRTTLVVGDTITAINLADEFNRLLSDGNLPVAVPLLGRTTRHHHLQHLYQSNAFRPDHWGLRWLDTRCAIQGAAVENDLKSGPLQPGDEPCERLQAGPPDNPGPLIHCPLFALCPSRQLYRDIPDAMIWITTPGAMATSHLPIATNRRQMLLGEIIYHESDLVIFDEVDTVQQWFDNVYASDQWLLDGGQGLLDVMDVKTIEGLNRGYQISRQGQRWIMAERSARQVAEQVCSMLRDQAMLREWLGDRYFTAHRLFFDLAHRLQVKTSNVDQEKINRVALDYFDQFRRGSILHPGDSYNKEPLSRLLAIADQVLARGGSLVDRERVLALCKQWLEEYVPDFRAIATQLGLEKAAWLEKWRHRSSRRTRKRPPPMPDDPETLAVRLELAISVTILEEMVRITFDSWQHAPLFITSQIADDYRLSRIPRDLAGILPISPTGSLFGFQYLEESGASPDTSDGEQIPLKVRRFSTFQYRNIGRWYVEHFHELLSDLGYPGPNVLAMSGTSWLPDSATWHFPVEPGAVLEPTAYSQQAIETSEFFFRPVRDSKGKPIFVSGSGHLRQQLALLGKQLAGYPAPKQAFLPQELKRLTALAEEQPEIWGDRVRLLLFVNSYEQVQPVMQAILSQQSEWNKLTYGLVRSAVPTQSTEWQWARLDGQMFMALLEFRGLTRKNGYVPPNRAKDVEIKSRPS
jgi:hypothetical protein